MINNKSVLAITLARGGSKGIPKKNIIDIHGKPLLQYTIDEDQLPAETARLLGNSIERLMGITASPPEEDDMLTTKTMKEVNALRQELAGVDTMLGDVSSIIDQYLEYQYEAQRRMTNSEGEIEI